MKKIRFIVDNNIKNIVPLHKGWSKDKKFILEDDFGNMYLLRISSSELYEKKKRQFELLDKIRSLNILCSEPIEFGTLDDGSVYIILSYLPGEDGIVAVSKMSNDEAYDIGIEAGVNLRKIHNLDVDIVGKSWWENYQDKSVRKINALATCGIKIPLQDEIIEYYKANSYLMKDRPLKICHGDFHLGNMIIENFKIGIIDFDKNGLADPYDDFKSFCWNVMVSEYFETGLINGYFNNNVPEDFFKILKFYTAETMISHLPWAITFGKEEIEKFYEVANLQLQWYDNFRFDVPTWYKGIIK